MDEHWKDWLHQKLETLGNKTPVQAARTPDGREMLEAMFSQMKRDDEVKEPLLRQREYIDRARRELGMK